MEKPGGLQSMGSQRVGHDWATSVSFFLSLQKSCRPEGSSKIHSHKKVLKGKNLHFPGGSAGKNSACNVGDLGLIPGLGRSPGEGDGYPSTPVFWPGEFHGLQSMGLQRVGHDWETFTFTFHRIAYPGGLSFRIGEIKNFSDKQKTKRIQQY